VGELALTRASQRTHLNTKAARLRKQLGEVIAVVHISLSESNTDRYKPTLKTKGESALAANGP
jgi:aspartate 1-decarboxylase